MDARSPLPRVVVAVSPHLRRRIGALLADCDLRFVETAQELLYELDRHGCDMLVLGAHFEQSTALAALERVLARRGRFPVVVVRGRPFATLGAPTLDAVRMASRALGAQSFIDLLEYPDDDEGNARVRSMLSRLLHG
jgi:hypothetical protein